MPGLGSGASEPSRIQEQVLAIQERLSHAPRVDPPPDGPSPQQVEALMRRSGVEPRLLEARVEEIPAKQRAMLGRWLAGGNDQLDKGHGLYMWGPVGTGKSMAACLVLRRLCEFTDSVRWWAVPDLMVALENPYQRSDVMKQAMGVRALVLDDLGAQVLTERYAAWLDQIGDARYRRRRTTVVTTNVAPQFLGLDRVADRWRQTMWEIEFTGRSRREHEDVAP